MDSSISATRIIGREILFSTMAIMINIAAIEMAFTILKSVSVVSIISFVQEASPISIALSSYFFSMAASLSI